MAMQTTGTFPQLTGRIKMSKMTAKMPMPKMPKMTGHDARDDKPKGKGGKKGC